MSILEANSSFRSMIDNLYIQLNQLMNFLGYNSLIVLYTKKGHRSLGKRASKLRPKVSRLNFDFRSTSIRHPLQHRRNDFAGAHHVTVLPFNHPPRLRDTKYYFLRPSNGAHEHPPHLHRTHHVQKLIEPPESYTPELHSICR
jgi:hypothetical protein